MKNTTWIRYLVKNPTEVFGNYSTIQVPERKLEQAKSLTESGGFILDLFQPQGYGFKIVFTKN